MRKCAAAFAIAAGALAAACGPHTPPAQPVSIASSPPPPVTSAPTAPDSAAPDSAAAHTVTVRVSGPLGSVFQVTGAVFGDTGLIDMPDAGTDSASFTTDDTGDLGLSVRVLPGPDPRTCAIEIDGATITSQTGAPGAPAICDSARAT